MSVIISPIEYLVPKSSKSSKLRTITLENGLVALLVCDIDIESTAVSMSVCSGSNNNGEIQGLAHLVEHLLFSGSKNYPKPCYIIDQILKVNGKINANTSHSYTNYHFEIPMNYMTAITQSDTKKIQETPLNHILQVFADMFKSPLFNAKMIQREIEEINEEHMANVSSIDKQFYHCLRLISDNNSSFRKFATGTTQTLSNIPGIRKHVINFFKKYYHCGNLKLVVKSPLSLNQLQKLVVSNFSSIQSGNRNLTNIFPIFNSKEMNTIIHVRNKLEVPKMRVVYPISQLNDVIVQLSKFWVEIIGQEGSGSLCEHLLNEELATEITVFDQFIDTNNLILVIELCLTSKGRMAIDSIFNLINTYISLLVNAKPELIKTLFSQFVALEKFNFSYQDVNDSLLDDVAILAERLQILNPRYILFGYKPTPEVSTSLIIIELKKRLDISKASCILISPKFNNWDLIKCESNILHDEFYNIDYQILKFDTQFQTGNLNTLNVQLPGPNKFLTKKIINQNPILFNEKAQLLQYDIKLKIEMAPQLIEYSSSFELWYKREPNNSSKVFTSFQFMSRKLQLDCFNLVSIELLCGIISLEIKKALFATESFGFTWSMFSTLNSTNSICINLNGIRPKYKQFLKLLVKTLKYQLETVGNTPYSTFRRCRVKLRKDYEQIEASEPFRRCLAGSLYLFEENIFSVEQRVETLSLLTVESVSNTAKCMLQSLYTTILANGDIDIDDVYEISYIINNVTNHLEPSSPIDLKLPSSFSPLLGKYILKLDKRQSTKTNFNYFYIHLGYRESEQVRVLSRVIEHLINQNLNNINSKGVVGYKILSGLRIFRKTIGVFIYVESSEYGGKNIMDHIEDFLYNLCLQVKDLDSRQFATILQACSETSNKDMGLSPNYIFEVMPEYCSTNFSMIGKNYYDHKSYWEKIVNRCYRFEGKFGNEAINKGLLLKLTKEVLLKFLCDSVSPQSDTRSIIVVTERPESKIEWDKVLLFLKENDFNLTEEDKNNLIGLNDWGSIKSYIQSKSSMKFRLIKAFHTSKSSQLYRASQIHQTIDIETYRSNCKVIGNKGNHRETLSKYI